MVLLAVPPDNTISASPGGIRRAMVRGKRRAPWCGSPRRRWPARSEYRSRPPGQRFPPIWSLRMTPGPAATGVYARFPARGPVWCPAPPPKSAVRPSYGLPWDYLPRHTTTISGGASNDPRQTCTLSLDGKECCHQQQRQRKCHQQATTTFLPPFSDGGKQRLMKPTQ
jgi:hypothetical protein